MLLNIQKCILKNVVLYVSDSQFDSNHSSTLGKDRAANKGKKKWGGILGGKHKHSSRHDDNTEGIRGSIHDSLVKHPLPVTISKEQMVRDDLI